MGLGWLTFGDRVLLAIGFLCVASAVELLVRGASAVRWRLSLFLIEVGKGLGGEPGLARRVIQLGAQAGASAGVLIGCLLVFVATVRRPVPPVPLRVLFGALRAPVLLASLGGVLGAAIGWMQDPASALGDLFGYLAPEDARPLLVVWRTHAGLYGGAALGTFFGAWSVWRYRGRTAPARSPERGLRGQHR